jgi:DNA primase
VLFNLHRARETMRQEKRVVLVEGYMDAIAVFSAGVKNVVASCGTALNLLHVKALSPLVKTVVVNYDPDAAGRAATERSLATLLEEDLQVQVLALPAGLDPDEYIKVRGVEAYGTELGRAPSFFDFLIERVRSQFDLGTPAGRADAANHVLQYVNRLPDAMERSEMAKDLADRLGLERQVVGRQMAAAAAERRLPIIPQAGGVSQYEKELLRVILESPESRSGLLAGLAEAELWSEWPSRPIFVALANMDLPAGERLDVTALLDRLEPADRARLADLIHQEAVELISVEKARRYVEELRRHKELRRIREQKKQELAAAGSPQEQARIALEIRQIDAELARLGDSST